MPVKRTQRVSASMLQGNGQRENPEEESRTRVEIGCRLGRNVVVGADCRRQDGTSLGAGTSRTGEAGFGDADGRASEGTPRARG